MRLTQRHKDIIAESACIEKFDALISASKVQESTLAQELFDEFYTEEVKAKMAKLPDEAFFQTNSIEVRRADNGKRKTIYMTQSRKCFAVHHYGLNVIASPKQLERCEENLEEQRTLNARRNTLKSQLVSLLRSVNTDHKLLEVWPDSKPLLEKCLGQRPVINPPALLPGAFKSLIEVA